MMARRRRGLLDPARAGRLVRWIRTWPARRVALGAVVGLLLVSATLLGQYTPLQAQEEAGSEAEGAPRNVAGVRISGLSGSLTYGGSDSFTVEAFNLTTVLAYDVIVSRNSSTLGIGACGTASQSRRVSGVESQRLTFTVHGCAAGSGTVTAVVRRSGLTTNEGAASQTVTVTATTPAAPARPTAPNPKARAFTAQWQAPTETGGTALTGFRVVMRANGASWPGDNSSAVKKVGASARSYTFSGLAPNRIYWFKVKACNGANQTRCSGWSSQASVTLPIDNPGTPRWGSFSADATQIRVTWSAPSDTGGVGLTGYGLRHWRVGASEPSSAQAVVNAQTTSRTFTSLAANTPYRFSIQACNGPNRCSGWTNKDGRTDPTPTPPPPPDPTKPSRVGRPAVNPRDAALHVDWDAPGDGGSAITHYDVQHRAGTAGAWTATEVRTGTSTTLTGLVNGTSYQVQVRAANAAGDGAWSATATGTPIPTPTPEAPRPQNLDVAPQHGRKAVLTWTAVSGTTKYEVQARVFGEDDWKNANCNDETNAGRATHPRCVIELERITTVGLQHHEAFALQVRALEPKASEFSATVVLIDTPITKATGANSQAEITWQPVGKAVTALAANFTDGSYQLRYRKADPGDHRKSGWSPSQFEDAVATHATTERILNPGTDDELRVDVIDAISAVQAGPLYAVQLVYKDDPDNSQDADVYAARNVYVWPSSSEPGAYSYVGGMSLVPRLASQNVTYRICGDSFGPSGDSRREAWVKLIKSAFGQWTAATQGLVNFLEPLDRCATDDVSGQTYVTIRERIRDHLANESPSPVLPADPDILGHIVDYVKGLSRDGIISGISNDSRTYSDVFMFDDMALGPLVHSYVLKEIALDIGYGVLCWFDSSSGKWAKTRMCTGSSTIVGDVVPSDIIVRRGAYDAGPWSDLESGEQSDDLRIPVNDARFNTCFNDDSDGESAYTDMVHEVGHLIGVAGHPVFEDSVMNYDHVVFPSSDDEKDEEEDEEEEPDCSPHPIDIMAVYALYQTGF